MPKRGNGYRRLPRDIEENPVNFTSLEFTGKWYKRYGIPTWFESKRGFNVTAEYSVIKDTKKVKVVNRETYIYFGKRFVNSAVGTAKIDPTESNRLAVSFDPFRLFYGEYWVRLFENGFMFVSTHNHKYGWILTRQPYDNDEGKNKFVAFLAKIKDLGVDMSAFQPVSQELEPQRVPLIVN